MEPEKFLTPTEFTALLKAAKDNRERCILLLLAGAGLRAGEMTQIRAEDIDFQKGYLHIQALNSKGKKPRTVVLIPLVTDALKRQLDDRTKGWLFPSYRDGHISSRHVQNILDGIATRAKLQEVKHKDKAGKDRHRIHPHLLRHSFAIWSLDSGVPVGDLQDQLGHGLLKGHGVSQSSFYHHKTLPKMLIFNFKTSSKICPMTISLRTQQNLIESFLKEWPGTVKDIGGKTRTRPMIVVATQ